MPYGVHGFLVPREGLPHPHKREIEPSELDPCLPIGSGDMLQAALAGAPGGLELPTDGIRLDHTGLVRINLIADRAWATRTMGSGITTEMNGYKCKSKWAKDNMLRTLKDMT